jgi:hypothetical protein
MGKEVVNLGIVDVSLCTDVSVEIDRGCVLQQVLKLVVHASRVFKRHLARNTEYMTFCGCHSPPSI